MDGKKLRTRSPAYPFVNLETALRRAKEFYDEQQHHAAPIKVAVKLWGYEEKSSGGLQTAAALVSFGLLSDEGTGESRKVQLTQPAMRILLNPDAAAKEKAIKEAALAPKIHRQVWQKWGANPPEASMRFALLTEWEPRFNPNTVDTFIREYRDTIKFAKLSESDKLATEVKDNGDEGKSDTPYVPQIGDFVQWELNGVLQFKEPQRIRDISPDGKFAFVDGQFSGLHVEQLIREKAPENVPPPRVPPPLKQGMQEFVVPLSDGSRAVFQWPTSLSKEDVADLKDSLKIVERKIDRSLSEGEPKQ